MLNVLHHDHLDSTNLEAVRLITDGKITTYTTILADVQSAGQGSRGRKWSSDKAGNLLVSYIFPIEQDWPQKSYLALYPVSMAVYRFIGDLLGGKADISIKWPNDILLEEKKLGGMLHEIHEYNGQAYFIAGIGLNIAWHPDKTDHFPATSLSEYTRNLPAVFDVATELGEYIKTELSAWKDTDFETYKTAILPCFYRLREDIVISTDRDRNDKMAGIFKTIDENGALVLKNENGEKRIATGDIFPNL